MIATSHDLGSQMVASWKGHPLISGKSRLVNDPVLGAWKGGPFLGKHVVSFFDLVDLGRAGDFGVCVVVVVVGCPMSHTLSRWETLDDFFSGIQDLSFHICLLFCWLLLQPATPVTHQEYCMLNCSTFTGAPIIQHPGSQGNLASQAVVSALLVTVAAFVLIFGIDKVTF